MDLSMVNTVFGMAVVIGGGLLGVIKMFYTLKGRVDTLERDRDHMKNSLRDYKEQQTEQRATLLKIGTQLETVLPILQDQLRRMNDKLDKLQGDK